jgi:hypothetical protein
MSRSSIKALLADLIIILGGGSEKPTGYKVN